LVHCSRLTRGGSEGLEKLGKGLRAKERGTRREVSSSESLIQKKRQITKKNASLKSEAKKSSTKRGKGGKGDPPTEGEKAHELSVLFRGNCAEVPKPREEEPPAQKGGEIGSSVRIAKPSRLTRHTQIKGFPSSARSRGP